MTRTKFNQVLQFIIFLIPIISWILPANYFDQGTVVCLSKRFLNMECWGCGMTRALQHFMHLDWKISWDFNPRVVVVAPLLIYLYLKEMRELYLSLFNLPRKELDS